MIKDDGKVQKKRIFLGFPTFPRRLNTNTTRMHLPGASIAAGTSSFSIAQGFDFDRLVRFRSLIL